MGNLVEIRHNTDGNAANDVVYSFEQDALGRQTAVKVGNQTTGTLIHSATICRMHFPPSAAYKNLDLPQVNLRFLQLHLTKNSSTSRPPHLCGVTLTTEYVEYNESHIKRQANNFPQRTKHRNYAFPAGNINTYCVHRITPVLNL